MKKMRMTMWAALGFVPIHYITYFYHTKMDAVTRKNANAKKLKQIVKTRSAENMFIL